MSQNLQTSKNQKKEEEKKKPEKKEKKEKKEQINKLPILKIQSSSCYPTGPYCFFFISIGFFILGCQATGWYEYGSTFINSIFFILGICQYILGIYDWYQKNNLLSLQNIIFGIWYISYFLNIFEVNGVKKSRTIYNYIQGLIDLAMLLFICILILTVKGKGIAYTIDYFGLFFAFAFLALCGYSNDHKIVIKIAGYVYFVNFVLFWLTGLSIVINDLFIVTKIKLVEPRIQ